MTPSGQRWLPDPVEDDSGGLDGPAWLPPSLGQLLQPDQLNEYAYVVVDEIVGDAIGLAVSAWPRSDEHGRLRFPGADGPALIGVDRNALMEALRTRWIPELSETEESIDSSLMEERAVEIGDAFAITRATLDASPVDPEEGFVDATGWAGTEIYDVSYEARRAARLASTAAVTQTLSDDEANRYFGEPPDSQSGPDDGGSGGVPPSPPPRPRTPPGIAQLTPDERLTPPPPTESA